MASAKVASAEAAICRICRLT